MSAADAVIEQLRRGGVQPGDLVALALAPAGAGIAATACALVADGDAAAVVGAVDAALRPRWVVWASSELRPLVASGTRIATAWDLAAVHRLLVGGWRADPGRVWAEVHGLSATTMPTAGPPDLFHQPEGDPDEPVAPDGHLRPDWVAGGWAETPGRTQRWAELALGVAVAQQARIADGTDAPRLGSTARAESTAELLCQELAVDGLPVDRVALEAVLATSVGPRPATASEADRQRAARDAEVLVHASGAWDLRSPGQVRSLLRSVGIEVPDTRAWRLERLRGAHPAVDALLAWRKAERLATTYGYRWLDDHVGVDGRLRGEWTACDGAAGRMTATAGLHSFPAELRVAVVAEPGHRFVRADLGQVEPRVLAAISGDDALAAATAAPDLYAPVAARLGVDRETAKVAVLGAMYGQTTGRGAEVLRQLERSYPVAMAHLATADRAARAGRALRTHGGRRLPMGRHTLAAGDDDPVAEREDRRREAARGRYGRNAVVQGAAAELFKVWAVTVRARVAPLGGRVVLCLHDELLVHVPVAVATEAAAVVDAALDEAAHRWAPASPVRFVSDTSVVRRWADAKA